MNEWDPVCTPKVHSLSTEWQSKGAFLCMFSFAERNYNWRLKVEATGVRLCYHPSQRVKTPPSDFPFLRNFSFHSLMYGWNSKENHSMNTAMSWKQNWELLLPSFPRQWDIHLKLALLRLTPTSCRTVRCTMHCPTDTASQTNSCPVPLKGQNARLLSRKLLNTSALPSWVLFNATH